MPDPQPTDAPPFETRAGVQAVWDQFRRGSLAICPSDGAPMALSVDGDAAQYRLVCTRCGVASEWFDAPQGEVHLRETTSPAMLPRDK